MAEVTWPAEVLIGRIKWTPPMAVTRQTSPWTGATREVELGPADRWRASVPVHLRDHAAGKLAWRAFDARMRQAGAWVRLPSSPFPQASTDPALTIAAVSAGSRSATLTGPPYAALARAGHRMTIASFDGAAVAMVTLLSDIDVGAGGTVTVHWAEALRFPSGTAVEACNPYVRMRYVNKVSDSDLPGRFLEMDALSLEEAF